MQKSKLTDIFFDTIISEDMLRQISIEVTGCTDFDIDFVGDEYTDNFIPKGYNKGRLGILHYNNQVTYISFSDEKCEGRNSGFQSIPTAFNMYFLNSYPCKSIIMYFLPCIGNNATEYHLFMYRLMKTAGIEFINTPIKLKDKILPFSSIESIIRARSKLSKRNKGNNATYIVKEGISEYKIYGKTYGASKYETSLICYAISKLAKVKDRITLYEYNEKDLKELPKISLEVIKAMGNIQIVNIDDELEKRELEEYDSLRSPRFNARLLDRLGEKHCVLCNCGISEIIQGAHIWAVADIKHREDLSFEDKLNYATDGENGLWMCQNHHKLFDTNILILSPTGKVSFKDGVSDIDKKYLNEITTVSSLPEMLITPKFTKYVLRRYGLY